MKRNNSNKTIGIIGGMGPQASAKLLEILIDMCTKDFGAKNDDDFPEIILNSVGVPDFISNQEDLQKVFDILKIRVKLIEKFNPVCFGIACNTAHVLLKDLQATTNVPFVSIIDAVVEDVIRAGITKVGLLSTPVTVKTGLYQAKCDEKKINLITPLLSEQKIVEEVIRNVLAGKIEDDDIQKLILVAESLRNRGSQAVILGCTELPLIFPKTKEFATFDSIEILAKALLQRFFESKGSK